MIDVEEQIIDAIKQELLPLKVLIVTDNDDVPSRFPCVYIAEMDSSNDEKFLTSSRIDTYDKVMYQIYVYSNRLNKPKEQCKEIMSVIDRTMKLLGFCRKTKQPLGALNKYVKFAYVMRYSGEVSALAKYDDNGKTKNYIFNK